MIQFHFGLTKDNGDWPKKCSALLSSQLLKGAEFLTHGKFSIYTYPSMLYLK